MGRGREAARRLFGAKGPVDRWLSGIGPARRAVPVMSFGKADGRASGRPPFSPPRSHSLTVVQAAAQPIAQPVV